MAGKAGLAGGCLGILLALARPAAAETTGCPRDVNHPEITCVRLTQPVLMGLRGQTMDHVRFMMDAPGILPRPNVLRFVSGFSKAHGAGTGVLNVLFEDGHATIVNAAVETGTPGARAQFIWNAYAPAPLSEELDIKTRDFARPAFCSDLAKTSPACAGGTMERELILTKMAFGARKPDLLQILDGVCQGGDNANTTPTGGCVSLREQLR